MGCVRGTQAAQDGSYVSVVSHAGDKGNETPVLGKTKRFRFSESVPSSSFPSTSQTVLSPEARWRWGGGLVCNVGDLCRQEQDFFYKSPSRKNKSWTCPPRVGQWPMWHSLSIGRRSMRGMRRRRHGPLAMKLSGKCHL